MKESGAPSIEARDVSKVAYAESLASYVWQRLECFRVCQTLQV